MSGNNSLETVSTSCYDDDDVFSAPSSNYNQIQNSNANNQNSQNNQNLDTLALLQLYRNFLSNSGNNANCNDLLANYSNLNLAAFPDLLNTLVNAQLKANSAQNVTSNSQMLSQQAVASAFAANSLKQRQNLLFNNRSTSGSNGNSSNIAALASATSNIASLLNNSNQNQNQLQQQQNVFMNNNSNSNDKRRINSSNSFSQSSLGSNNPFGNNSSLCLSNVGPNASHLLQNSSLASSARLNTSNSASAAVLGNNSSLNHTLSSLQHQASNILSSASNNSQNQSNLLNFTNSNQSNLLNFNSSPNSASNGLLSALLMSQSNGANQVMTSSGKPLRSERLPSHVVDEIVRQAKIRRKNGGKKEVCVFCRNNGEKEQIYTSHTLKDACNNVACPILRLYQCPICHASGDQAHTIKYCPFAEKDSTCIKLFKETGRMNAAFLNSFAGINSPPALTPPESPSQNHLN